MSAQAIGSARDSRGQTQSQPLFSLFEENVELLLALVTLIFLLVGWIGGSLTQILPIWGIVVCAIVAYGAGGYSGFIGALGEMRRGKLDIDFLMIAAAIGAALIGEWEEGALLLFLFTLSGALEEFAMDRTRQAIQSLSELRPDTAQRLHDGREVTIPVTRLVLDDLVLVRPGERLPVDGCVTQGRSSIDQSPITGESIPVMKGVGSQVFAGTINGGGVLEVRVTKVAADSTLSKIITLVEEAREDTVPAQRFIDRFSGPYTWAVIGMTILAILIPVLFANEPFSQTFYRAMTLLVVASPCALVISTPASILSAIAAAARRGMLFKGGIYLEKLAQVRIAAFDKTGTLTHGRPVVTDIRRLNGHSEEELLVLAASAEKYSEHHLAQAILNKAQEQQVQIEEPSHFEAIAGQGVRATFQRNIGIDHGSTGGEERIYVGNDKLFKEMALVLPEEVTKVGRELQQQGKTAVLIVRHQVGTPVSEAKPVGFVAVADTVRDDAAANIAALRQQGIEHIAMLTGDNQDVASVIANDLEIDDVYSELLPDQKVAVLRKLQSEGETFMVGDGVNDAPALAVAGVGIAMGGSGTDAALETADLVLMGDRLSNLPFAIRLSRQAQRIVKQNVFFSILVMLTLIILTIIVPIFWTSFHLPLPVGVVGHEGSTLLVVANGLRLLRLSDD
ncbi:MAG: heavy metal translocating P-type ATPase [Chloroflexota bacterium]